MNHLYERLPHIAWRGQYSTGLRAQPLGTQPIVVIDEKTPFYLQAKREALSRERERRYCTTPDFDEIRPLVERTLLSILDSKGVKPRGDHQDIIEDSILQIPDDVAIMRTTDDRNWLSMAHICLPSGWCPSEKIGLDFTGIHKPVGRMSNMKYGTGQAIARQVAKSAEPLIRWNWGLQSTGELDRHPSRIQGEKPYEAGNPLYIREERQVLHPLGNGKDWIFFIRTYVADTTTLTPEEARLLIQEVETLGKESEEYKFGDEKTERVRHLRLLAGNVGNH